MFKKIKTFIKRSLSPFLIVRFYILRDIKKMLKKYNFNGSIIDVGCGTQPYKKYFLNSEYFGIDFKGYMPRNNSFETQPDFYFPESYNTDRRLPFEDSQFDHAVAFQVLEHSDNPQMLINEIFRITKNGGYIALSFPLIGGLHMLPHDYFRYTEYGIEQLVKNINCVILEKIRQGSLLPVISIMLNESLVHFMSKDKIRYFFGALIYPPLLLFQYLSLAVNVVMKPENIFINYFFIIQKNKQ